MTDLTTLPEWRWNFRETPGGAVEACRNEHDKRDACVWEPYVPQTAEQHAIVAERLRDQRQLPSMSPSALLQSR
jgi:hypothetical protein